MQKLEFDYVKNKIEEKGFSLLDKEYINSKTLMTIICNKGHIFKSHYNSIVINNRGCPICAKEKRANSRKLSESEIKERYLENGFVLFEKEYEKYTGKNSKLKCRCLRDFTICEISISQLYDGIKCSICRKESFNFRHNSGYTFNEIKILMGENYIALDDFEENKRILFSDKLNFYCKKHDSNFTIQTKNIFRGSNCPKCGKERLSNLQKINFKKIEKDFNNRGYTLLSSEKEYKGIHSKLKYLCPNHKNKELYISYDSLKQGQGCPYCAGNGKYSYEEFIDIFKENGFEPLFIKDDCINTSILLNCKCVFTGEKTKLSLNTINQMGHVCPYCTKSLGESLVEKVLKNNDVDFIFQKTFPKCKHINKLRFDFYLPDYNLCIEYQGKQHNQPIQFGSMTKEDALIAFGLQIKKDNIKRRYCKNNNIELLEIYWWDKNKIEQIILSTLEMIKNVSE